MAFKFNPITGNFDLVNNLQDATNIGATTTNRITVDSLIATNGIFDIDATPKLSIDSNFRQLHSTAGTIIAGWGQSGYAFYATLDNGATRSVYLDDGTYALNVFGQAHFTGSGGFTVVDILSSGYAMTWDVTSFWGGALGGSGGALYAYDNNGHSLFLADGTYAINATGTSRFEYSSNLVMEFGGGSNGLDIYDGTYGATFVSPGNGWAGQFNGNSKTVTFCDTTYAINATGEVFATATTSDAIGCLANSAGYGVVGNKNVTGTGAAFFDDQVGNYVTICETAQTLKVQGNSLFNGDATANKFITQLGSGVNGIIASDYATSDTVGFYGDTGDEILAEYSTGTGYFKYFNGLLYGDSTQIINNTNFQVNGFTEIYRTGEQLRIGYNGANYLSTTVSSVGGVTFNATGTTPSFTFSDTVNIAVTSATSARETLLKTSVSDAGNDAFFIGNGTITDARFIPSMIGYVESTNAAASLQHIGLVRSADDASDSSTVGIIDFYTGRTTSATDPLNGTLSAIANRKLYTWRNFSTVLMTMYANGNLLIGANTTSLTASPLNVSFGGTYGSNSAGNKLNLKWDMYNDGAGNRYGIGMSAGLMEFQAGTSGGHAFFVNQGTEAMRILSSTNIGIGTTTPSTKLHVAGITEQLRLGYDASNYSSFTVSSTGLLTIGAMGGRVQIPAGSVIAGNGPGLAVGFTDTGIAANADNLAFWESGVIALNLTNTLKEFRVPSDYKYAWSSATNNNASSDTSMYRNSAGVLRTGGNFLVDGSVGIGITTPNANAILDVTSTTKAFMPPRMTTTQKNNIASPTAGMVVYDTTLNKLAVYTTAWESVTSL